MKKIISLLLVLSVFVSGCSLFKKDPQKAVNDSMSSFGDVEKMSSSLVLSGTVQAPAGEKPANVRFNLELMGKSDVTDEKSPKVDMKVTFSGSADEMSGNGEFLFRTVDKKIYFNLSKFEVPGPAGEALKTQLGSLLAKWWFLPMTDQTPLSNVASEQKELQEKFKNAKFFVNASEEVKEEVHGVATTKYRVELDKEALKKFILEVGQTSGNQLSPEEELAMGDALQEVEFSGALWVGDDGVMHRVKGTVTLQPKQGPSSSFDLDYSGWDFGADVAVSAPESPEEFNPFLIFSVLGALGGVPAGGDFPVDVPLGAGQVE